MSSKLLLFPLILLKVHKVKWVNKINTLIKPSLTKNISLQYRIRILHMPYSHFLKKLFHFF